MARATSAYLLVAAATVVVTAAFIWWRYSARRREKFSFSDIIKGTVNVSKAVAKVTVDAGKAVGKVVGIGGGSGGGYKPTYRGRQWDGYDWSCPAGTFETGNVDDSKACITSQFHPPVWRWDGKEWNHSCPNLTVPTDESVWEKKCEAGWVPRQQIEGVWQCPPDTDDSGKTWENSPWRDAQKQCKVRGPYTRRVPGNDKTTWVCPAGTKDTGLTWTSPQNGGNQCKWIGG